MDLRVPVFMNWGNWVARCPRPGCFNAEQFGQCHDGTVGGLTSESFCCRPSHNGCGLTCGADWPALVEEIEFMLRPRPVGARNWFPGETVEDLLQENVQNGLIPKNELRILNGKIEVLREIQLPEPRIQIGTS